MNEKYADQGLAVISVHSPKYEHEKDRGHVARAAERYGLGHPIYLDNDEAYFDALGRALRPVFFLVDRQGRIRARATGEMQVDAPRSNAVEAQLRDLLAERAS